MNRTHVLPALLLTGVVAHAQTPSFLYSLYIEHPTLGPGESTIVAVLCGYTPAIGQPIMTPAGAGTVLAPSFGRFDLNASDGKWTLGTPPVGSLVHPFNFPLASQGTPTGGSVTGVLWATGFPPPPILPILNPADVWVATFTAPVSPGPIDLELNPTGDHALWAVPGLGGFAVEVPVSNVTGARATITVIPAPAGPALLGVLGAGIARRRGRRR